MLRAERHGISGLNHYSVHVYGHMFSELLKYRSVICNKKIFLDNGRAIISENLRD